MSLYPSKEKIESAVRGATSLPGQSRRLKPYGLALLFVALAALLRWLLPEVLGPAPFLAFYLAWVAAAALGGLGPGLLATVASWLCIDLLFDPTNRLINFADPTTTGRLAVLLAGGLGVSLVADRMRRGRARERRQARALRESQERLGAIVNSAMDAIISVDEQQRIVLFNPAAERLFGHSAAEAIGQPLERLIPERFRRVHQEHIRDYANTGVTTRRMGELGEISGLRANGEEFPIEASISQIPVAGGRLFTVILRDITERKRAEETLQKTNEQLQQQSEELQVQTEELRMQAEELQANEQVLRESEERFRAAYEQAAIGIEMLDREGQFLRGNGWLSRMLGYREEELLQRTFAQITHPDDLREELPLIEQLWAGAIPSYSIEKRYLHQDGHSVWVRVTSSLVHTSTPYRISIIEDITERRQSEEALRTLNTTLETKVSQRTAESERRARQLQRLTLELSQTEDRERRQLAEVLHDDLQQVLAAAKFHLGILNNRIKGDPSQQALALQVDHMLVDAIAKSRSLSHELSPAVLYHDDFAETLRWLAGQVQAKHGLTVRVDTFGPTTLRSDALKSFLYKAAQELLFNVVKHARVKEARIRVRRLGRYICLSVSDRGRGFDPQEVRQTAGFGLFSIIERVELLGGRMKIGSVKGVSSVFRIMVPDDGAREGKKVGRNEVQSARTDEAATFLPSHVPAFLPSGPPTEHRLRVLLADDHKIVREGLISLLREAGDVEVVGEAANGREAVNQAYQLEPDVIVMDVAMPLINGDDATRQIKSQLPGTRVIALSMYEETDTQTAMREAGAESYVLKTAPSEELLAAIRGKGSGSPNRPV